MNTSTADDNRLYEDFNKYTITELQKLVDTAKRREEIIFYNRLLNLKMAFAQEKVVGKELL